MPETKEVTQKAPAKPVPKFRQAVDWALEKSMEKGLCGICNWEPWPHNKEQSLRKHITRKHRASIIELFDNEVLDLAALAEPAPPSLDDDELMATAGIESVEDLDHYDYLSVPTTIRERIAQDGAKGRWVRNDRIEHFLSQGATLTMYDGPDGAPHQAGSADGVLRTNELTHVTIPHEIAERRAGQKRARVQDQLNSRAEEVQKTRDAYERRSCDYLRKERNLDHSKASQVAKALTQRRTREGEPTNTMSIRDSKGSREY